jgi:hypothetical protein
MKTKKHTIRIDIEIDVPEGDTLYDNESLVDSDAVERLLAWIDREPNRLKYYLVGSYEGEIDSELDGGIR